MYIQKEFPCGSAGTENTEQDFECPSFFKLPSYHISVSSISGCLRCFKTKQEKLQHGLESRHNLSFDSCLPEHSYHKQKKKNAERWFVVVTHLI